MRGKRVKVWLSLFIVLASPILVNLSFVSVNPVQAESTAVWYPSLPSEYDIVGLTGVISNPERAIDKWWNNAPNLDTYTRINYGNASDDTNYFQVKTFPIPSWGADPPSITQVSFIMKYEADANTKGETYAIEFYVGPSGPRTLVSPTAEAHAVATETWNFTTKPAEVGGGAWTWADVGNIKFRVSASKKAGSAEDSYFHEYQAWAGVMFDEPTPTIMVSPSNITDYTKTPGTTFSVNVTVDNAAKLWGFQFYLSFNPYLLNYTDHEAYAPFVSAFPMQNDTLAGWAFIAYGSQFGEWLGSWGDVPLVRIDFLIEGWGESTLDLHDTELSDLYGGVLPHNSQDGYFRNVESASIPQASFNYTPLEPIERETVTFNASLSTPDGGTIASYMWYFGDNTSVVTEGDPTTTHSYTERGNYTIVLGVIDDDGTVGIFQDTLTVLAHDIAIVLVSTKPSDIGTGGVVAINVTVRNQGNFPETFNVITYCNANVIDTMPVTNLPAGGVTWVGFSWNTTGVSKGAYVISANTSIILYEYDTADNTYTDGTVTVSDPEHDVAITRVTPSSRRVTIGSNVTISVTARNDGNMHETFDVAAYYYINVTDKKLIDQTTVTSLTPDESTAVILTWNTTGVDPGVYTLSANASVVPGETETLDNEYVDGTVTLSAHDIAVTVIEVSPTAVDVGESVFINVTIMNKGAYTETNFNVSVKYDENVIDTQNVPSLDAGATINLTFTWDTTGVDLGVYTLSADASVVPGEAETLNNKLVDGTVTVLGHDIAVTVIEVSPTAVDVGKSVFINVAVENQGTFSESFNVTVYYNNTQIETSEVTDLANGTSTTRLFTWNTTGLPGGAYNITAEADIVAGETDVSDNMKYYDELITLHERPVASFTYSPSQPIAGDPVTFDASATTDPDGTVVSYDWDFGDGNVTTIADPIIAHFYTSDGTYTVTLTVTDNDGLFSTFTATLTVKLGSTISISATPTTVKLGKTTTIDGTIDPERVGVTVTIQWREQGQETWNNLATVQTNDNSQYSYEWEPTATGTFELRASWAGDENAVGAESSVQVVTVEEKEPSTNIYLYVGAGVAIIAIAAVVIYFLKIRKSE